MVTDRSPVPGAPTRPPRPAVSPLDPWPGTVSWRSVSRRLVPVELIRLAGRMAVLLLVVLVAGALGWPFVTQTLLVLAGYALLRTVATVRAVLAWGCAERDRDLLVRHGAVVLRVSIVPEARTGFVDVPAGPLEGLCGPAPVQLHTAAAASDARVPGLPPAEASRLRDRLTALGEALGEGL